MPSRTSPHRCFSTSGSAVWSSDCLHTVEVCGSSASTSTTTYRERGRRARKSAKTAHKHAPTREEREGIRRPDSGGRRGAPSDPARPPAGPRRRRERTKDHALAGTHGRRGTGRKASDKATDRGLVQVVARRPSRPEKSLSIGVQSPAKCVGRVQVSIDADVKMSGPLVNSKTPLAVNGPPEGSPSPATPGGSVK